MRCSRILNAKNIGLTITLADITEEEFRVLELIEAERQEGAAGIGSIDLAGRPSFTFERAFQTAGWLTAMAHSRGANVGVTL